MSIVYPGPAAAAQKGGSYPLYTTPATLGLTPNPLNQEFDSVTLPSAMEIWDATASAARSVAGNIVWRGTLPSGTNPSMDAHTRNGGRASMLRVQLPNTNTFFIGFPLGALPSTLTTYATRVLWPNPGVANGYVRFGLFGQTAGHIDPTNIVTTGTTDNQANLNTQCLLANVSQSGGGSGDSINRASSPPTYFYVERNPGLSPPVYSLCAMCEDGSAFVMQTTFQPAGFVPAYYGWQLKRAGMGAGTSNHFFEFDFLRVLDGAPFT